MHVLKISRFGGGLGLELSPDALAELGVSEGDALYLTKSPDGFRLTRAAPTSFERQMAAAEEVMARRADALRELAK
ncbi:MAG: AbrB/MazE/SpoVT family DNA-binding domain-containing protein [Pseudomonadota bacterium]